MLCDHVSKMNEAERIAGSWNRPAGSRSDYSEAPLWEVDVQLVVRAFTAEEAEERAEHAGRKIQRTYKTVVSTSATVAEPHDSEDA